MYGVGERLSPASSDQWARCDLNYTKCFHSLAFHDTHAYPDRQTDRQTHTQREKVAAAVLYLSTTVSLSKNTPFVVIANVSETFYSAAASGHSRRAFSTRLPLVLLDNAVHDVDMQTPHRIQSKPWRPHIGANGISWPPGKMDEKLKSENMQKKHFSVLQNAPFHSQIFKIFFASGGKGAFTPLTKSCGRSCPLNHRMYSSHFQSSSVIS